MDILSTLFHQQSRKIGMIVPSVVISEKHTDMLEITEHPVEVGAAVADHAYKKPSEVVMEVGFAGGGALLDFASNLTATSLLGLSPQQTYQELLDLQESRIPFDVVTGKRLYSNMLIRALEVTTDKTTENVLSAVLTLREVIISRTQQITVADKTNMKEGASTSAVQNSGNKTTKPPDTSLLKSITGNVASLLGGGWKRKTLEILLCGALTLTFASALEYVGWPKSLSVAIGGGVGLIGVDAIRGAAMRVIGNKFGGSKE